LKSLVTDQSLDEGNATESKN
jgi:SUMO ligase MMS21 Smc5/6 complex component